jgi:hypothetical protein
MSGTANTATAETPQVLLEHHLKMLRLPTFLREYDKVARQCGAASIRPVSRWSRAWTVSSSSPFPR